MRTITKIIRAKEKRKSLEIPSYFLDKDIKVTIETFSGSSDDKNQIEKNLKDFEALKELVKKKKIEIPSDMNIDEIMNEISNGLL